jgi:hypothetical protein
MAMKRNVPPEAPAAPVQPPVIPDWVNETPRDHEYSLVMAEPVNGEWMQDINLSRDEFIALKGILAVTRGYPLESKAAGPKPSDEDNLTVECRAAAVQALNSLDSPLDIILVSVAIEAIRGKDTPLDPAAHFIGNVLDEHRTKKKLTPETASEALEMFRGEFEDMRREAARFQKNYGL